MPQQSRFHGQKKIKPQMWGTLWIYHMACCIYTFNTRSCWIELQKSCELVCWHPPDKRKKLDNGMNHLIINADNPFTFYLHPKSLSAASTFDRNPPFLHNRSYHHLEKGKWNLEGICISLLLYIILLLYLWFQKLPCLWLVFFGSTAKH